MEEEENRKIKNECAAVSIPTIQPFPFVVDSKYRINIMQMN